MRRISFANIHFLKEPMFFSKSFGYALRGVLYIALTSHNRQRIQVEEIARKLVVPKYFLSKVIKSLVQKDILNSTKGPYGGISLNEKTLSTSLSELLIITSGAKQFDKCVMRLTKCNSNHPCPLHHKMEICKMELQGVLGNTTISDLLNADQPDYIKSIATI